MNRLEWCTACFLCLTGGWYAAGHVGHDEPDLDMIEKTIAADQLRHPNPGPQAIKETEKLVLLRLKLKGR